MSIEAGKTNLWGGGLPGNISGSSSQVGGLSSSVQVTFELRRKVMEFARAYSHKSSGTVLAQLAKEIEGELLTAQVLAILPAQQTDALIDALHDLLETVA